LIDSTQAPTLRNMRFAGLRAQIPLNDLPPNRSAKSSFDSPNEVKRFFVNQMIRAKRGGGWFRIPKRERSMYSLAMRLEVKFQSRDLLRALVSVLKHLKEAWDAGYIALTKGLRIAWAFSDAAVSWGNEEARKWRGDMNYARFLALTCGTTSNGL
jgi:hypothetical protein